MINLDELLYIGDDINIERNKKSLILKALIKTNFNLEEAYKLNCPEQTISFVGYKERIYALFPCGFKKLKHFLVEQGYVSNN